MLGARFRKRMRSLLSREAANWPSAFDRTVHANVRTSDEQEEAGANHKFVGGSIWHAEGSGEVVGMGDGGRPHACEARSPCSAGMRVVSLKSDLSRSHWRS